MAIALVVATGAQAMNVTSTGESGACSLRAAIQAVSTNNSGTPCGAVVSGGSTPINLSANTYTPFDGQLVVPAGTDITINGDNVNNPLTTVIDGAGGAVERVFEIAQGATVTLSGLTVTGGRTPDSPVGPNVYEIVPVPPGGGIWNKGSLTIDHSVVTGNRTGDGSQGAAPPPEYAGGGGGPGGDGGAIYNNDNASLTISSSKITDNATGNGGSGAAGAMGVGGLGHNPDGKAGGNGAPGGSGGGIYNSNFGTVTITNSTVSGNNVGRGGHGGNGGQGAGPSPSPSGGEFSGGKGGDGGDGGNSGKQYRKDQALYWDETRGGGGIYNLGNTTITNSTISGNTTGAGGNGGPSGPGGPQATGSSNFQSSGRAGSGGGGGRGAGLLNGSWHQGGMSLTNVTITGNLTGDGGIGGGGGGGAASSLGGGRGGYGGDGGGVWAQGAHDRVLQMVHVTIAKNFLGGAGPAGSSPNASSLGPGERGRGAGLTSGGRFNTGGAGVYLGKTLIVSNGNSTFDQNCFEATSPSYDDIVGQGFNLSYPNDGSCPDPTSVDPDLGLLGNNGGETQTMVPQPGSAAIGGVPLASCDITTDQRGFPRPGADGVSCDIGAVETGSAPVITPTTTQVTSSANPSTPGQQVTFTATVSPPPSSATVSFTDNGSAIPGCGSVALQPGGQFTCQVTFPSAGTHSIVASYTGNTLFGASTSPAYSQTVGSTTPSDTTPPDTVIDSGPSGTIKTAGATFAFHGTPGDTAKIQCKLDSGAFADCSSPKTFSSLSDGAHTVSFRAEDAAGNQDQTPAVGTFTVDTSTTPPPPQVPAKIGKVTVSGPGKVKKGGRATFVVSIKNTGDDSARGVKLKVSGGAAAINRSVGGIAGGQTKAPRVSVKLNKVGRIRLTFRVTSANAGGKSSAKKVTVKR